MRVAGEAPEYVSTVRVDDWGPDPDDDAQEREPYERVRYARRRKGISVGNEHNNVTPGLCRSDSHFGSGAAYWRPWLQFADNHHRRLPHHHLPVQLVDRVERGTEDVDYRQL